MPARRFDSARIQEIAREVEVFLSNYPRINSEEDFETFRKAISVWRQRNLDKGGYRDLMKYLRRQVEYTAVSPDRQMDVFRKKAKALFDLEMAITPPMDYEAWLRVKGHWKSKVVEALQGLPEVGRWLDKLHKDKKRDLKPTFSLPSTKNVSVGGFHMLFHEYDEESSDHQAFAEMLTDALRIYQQRAKRYLPVMLKHKLPMDVMFGTNYSSGNYGSGKITIYEKSLKSRERIVYTIAHETGHYFGLDWMSHAARAFWSAAIKQDMKPIKLSQLLDRWPKSTPEFVLWMRDARAEDPMLAMQLDAIWSGFAKMPKEFVAADDWTRGGLERYLQTHGDAELRVMHTPITPYANENPDEAFAEAVALLVAYGPQAVHQQVREWLKIVLPGEIKMARTQPEDGLVAVKALARFARVTRLDSSEIQKLRKDLLTLLKNLPRVDTYAKGDKLRDAFKVYRTHFNTVVFDHFLNHDLKETRELPDSDKQYLDKKLRKVGWDLYVELSLPLPYTNEYISEGVALQRFKEDSTKWANRVKTKARAFWSALDDAIEHYTRVTSKPGFDVQIPSEERVSMEGFDVLVVGYKHGERPDEDTDDMIAKFRAGLKHFKARAGQVLPLMLKAMLPIHVIAYLHKLDEGGRYYGRYIEVAAFGFDNFKNKNQMAQVIAHEMGHHLYKHYLSNQDREFWATAIAGNYGPLDVDKALKLWPDGAWAFEMPEKLKDVDPVLAVQLNLIGWGHEGRPAPQTKEEFQALVDEGYQFKVPQNPITAYAGKNAEEAFCDAVGNLIGYGPRTVDRLVQSWLKMIIPQLRVGRIVAARMHYTPAESTAINLLVDSPDATVDELIHKVRGFDMAMYDEATGQEVDPREVIDALERFAPRPLTGGDTKVYHATDLATANQLLRRGLIPETKPRPRNEEFEYAPGRGIDQGLYVGGVPRDVSGYGPVILEVVVPKKWLEVPTEAAQLGETDPMRALRSHDGAIVNHRLPADAFRILPGNRLAALKLALKVAARHRAAEVTLSDIQNLADDLGVGLNLPAEGQAFSWDDNDSLADAMLDDDTSLTPEMLPAVKLAARYQTKKKVPKANGKGTTEVYVYSERQVQHRNREKAKRLQKFKGKVEKLRSKVKADLGSDDARTRLSALAVALIDETHERVGNEESAKGKRNDSGEPHYGVTGWKKRHIKFSPSKATIRYVGKSGVKHEKTVSTPYVLKALRRAYKEADGKDGCLFVWDDGSITAANVNEFLEPFGITAKDLRGLAANALMQKALKKARKGALPDGRKERTEQLKREFNEALEEVSDELGHEASTLRSQYLAPSMEESYLKDGTVIDKLHEKEARAA